MSVEAKVGQMMMVGFGGMVVDEPVEALVRGKQVGGVCMFKRNIADAEQVGRLNDAVRALLADSIPPFIAVDQEGGTVTRIDEGMLVLPGNMALGATRDPHLAYEAGRAQAEDLWRLGFNMNLAPVLDVNINPRNPVIGIRAFGDQPKLVADFGADFVRGQQDANVATVAKHFPGHGSVDSDSHKMLPVLAENEQQLLTALEPFAAAMKVGLDGMMTAHVAAPKVTGNDVPATMSSRILSDILRRRMKFDGLVLTDELEMQAIADRFGVGRAAVMAVKAGADMVLIPWRVEKKAEVHAALLEAAKSGELPMTRVDQAVRRILRLKVRRGLFDAVPPLAERLKELGKRRSLADEISKGALTLLRTTPGVFPVKREKRVAVVTAEPSLVTAIQSRVPSATALVVPAFVNDLKKRDELKLLTQKLAQTADVVIVGIVNSRQLELVTMAHLTGKPVVVVVMGLPYLGAQVPEAKVVLEVYSSRTSATDAAAAALFGEVGTPGKLPVALLPRYPFGFGLDPVGDKTAHP
ncbi:MAG: beta-N-acetylhexosaminidase [Archangiaceae bacterium]|nr:beta-N-acetylhexosaminidase [Archangiaceae bacterium]